MCSEAEIVVRCARAGDAEARAQLVRAGVHAHDAPAFLLFFFQEMTLQALVLCGAVLFIFVGLGLAGVAGLVPALAALLALGVRLTHAHAADTHVQNMRKEMMGFVAELRAAAPQPSAAAVRVRVEDTPLAGPASVCRPLRTQLVGTVSVSEYRGSRRSGWLHALCVGGAWRRRGVGRALAGAARRHAHAAGLESLECVTSQLQHAARGLFHAAGWECRGWYHRPLCAGALSLLMAQLGLELPHA